MTMSAGDTASGFCAMSRLQGNFFDGQAGPTADDPCEGARRPLQHDHFFTATGAFGSHDEHGGEVNSGDSRLSRKAR